jgi:hypothetical protein
MPRVSPDGEWIYVSAYTHEGYDIARFRHPGRGRPAPPSRDLLTEVKYPDIDTSEFRETSYQPFRWMLPLTLTPNIGILNGRSGLGATVSGRDIVGHHSYSISGGVVRDEEISGGWAPNLGVRYTYGRLPFDVGLSGRLSNRVRTRSLFAGSEFVPFVERQFVAGARISYPIRQLDESVTLALAYDLDLRRFAREEPDFEFEPGDRSPSYPEQGWFNELRLSLGYASYDAYPYSVTTERGFGANLGLSVQHPALGSDYETLSINFGVNGYVPMPWLDGHVIFGSLSAGTIASNQDRRLVYGIGGVPPQNIFADLLFLDPRGGLYVRGFRPSVTRGSTYQVGRLEYRLPIVELNQGFSTIPLFFRRLKARAFMDVGAAYDGFLVDAELLTGIGAEVELDLLMAYFVGGSLRVGYAHGFGERGLDEVYLLYGGGF